ncbi:MAG TPA: hypothetical protein VGN48_16305 [Pedococcus sp.]|nr:hypothetical protein [Pedococcus sp.]
MRDTRIGVRLGAGVGLLAAASIASSARWGPDWAAQEYRAWSAAHNGLTAWTNGWYSGQALPGYSVLYPVVAGVLGVALTGLLAVVGASAGAYRLRPAGSAWRQIGYHVSVGVVLAGDLVIGQIPYLLGVAAGVWALVMTRAERRAPAAALAALCCLFSPLAGAFVLLCVPAVAAAYGLRRAVPLVTAAAGVVVAAVLGGGGGTDSFTAFGFAWTLVFAILGVVLTGAAHRPVRVLGLTYAASAVVLFVVPNPVGGNLLRLAQLLALPLLWHVWPRTRRRLLRAPVLVALVVLVTAWTCWPALIAAGRGAQDPSQSPGYYTGLLSYLRSHDPRAGRLEVVFTREHWEAMYVAKAFPIARGWERQTDLSVNAALYRPLTASRYRQWLDDSAVSLVALPRVPLDIGGRAEATLLRKPPRYLIPAWHDANWRVWRVVAARPMVAGPATLSHLGADSVELRFARAGVATVRVRASGMWTVTSGEACIVTTRGAWLRVQTAGPGRVVVTARVGLAVLDPGPRCT